MAYFRFQGSTMQVTDGTTATTVLMAIGGFTGFNHNSGSAKEVDRTNSASPRKESKQGLPDYGNFQLELQWSPADAGQVILETIRVSSVQRHFVYTYVSGHTISFYGYVKTLSFNTKVGEDMMGNCDIRITGPVVYT